MKLHGQFVQGIIGITSLAGLIMTPCQSAEAYWFPRRPASRYHRSEVIIVLPRDATRLKYSDGNYYYCRGRYYKHDPRGYVVIPAPVGAVISSLPEGHRTMIIDGVTYHEYDGVYYRGGPAGYTVVPIATSAATPCPVPVVTASTAATTAQPTVVVNVPNKNGSFTPVPLQLASSGMYIGPQGEVYPNLPTEAQLRSLYGK